MMAIVLNKMSEVKQIIEELKDLIIYKQINKIVIEIQKI
jgi:hypothetical protein